MQGRPKDKNAHLKQLLGSMGYTKVEVVGFVVGTLGSWDPGNDRNWALAISTPSCSESCVAQKQSTAYGEPRLEKDEEPKCVCELSVVCGPKYCEFVCARALAEGPVCTIRYRPNEPRVPPHEGSPPRRCKPCLLILHHFS